MHPLPTGQTELRWPELQLQFATLESAPVERTRWPHGGGGAMQELIGDDGERASWIIRAAADVSMREFDDDHHDWARSIGDELALCGEQVRIQIARKDAQDFECVISTTGNHPAHPPDGRIRGRRAQPWHDRARFEVESKHLDTWEPIARELLGSLRCL
jgi:hypothetical protein